MKIKNLNTPIFPFTAIVAQEEMKLALQLNIIDPKIGGVLIMGDRGSGKSTTIRSMIDLLPKIEVVKNNLFNSHKSNFELMDDEVKFAIKHNKKVETELKKLPMVDLPLGVTEDRICGTINIEKALTEGIKKFEPGLLAKANRGILYVDEINLLEDHLVNILLDSASSGWNIVEREGISIKHPSRFLLIGSGNPEEGELRPQLLDRFGMHVAINTIKDPLLRVKIVEERISFDKNPDFWIKNYEFQQQELRNKILNAQLLLPTVTIDYKLQIKISKVCSLLEIDGLRGDIVINRAAKAYAAYNNRNTVTMSDIQKTIILCLRHRLRKDPMLPIDSGKNISHAFNKVFEIY